MGLHELIAPMLAYAGPDQILPLTSFLAAIVGFLLIFWKWVVSFVRRGWASVMARVRPTKTE